MANNDYINDTERAIIDKLRLDFPDCHIYGQFPQAVDATWPAIIVQLIASGMTIAAAGRAAGYASASAAREAARRPAAAKALEFLREEMREVVNFKKENAHMMYMESYQAAANATEMKNTVDSLVKLHGLAIPDNATQVNINIQGTKQLERMSDEDLLKLAGQDTNYLEPSPEG